MRHRLRFSPLLCLIAACVVFAGLASQASAQAGYYVEETKDGRIYVFVTQTAHEAWKASGEMGAKVVTRLDYGPKGETVMFESGDAITIYNAKWQKNEPPPKAPAADVALPFNVQYRMPGLRLSFPKAEINLSNRLQVRFTEEQFDDIRVAPTPLPTALEDKGSFRIRRMKTKFDGWIYSKDLTYELQLNWPDSANVLEDANLDYDFTNGKKLFRIKAGQFKAPFSQQQLTSSGNQQFVDRSLLDGQFVPGRQIGVQAWGQFGGTSVPDFIDWRLGVFNGNGRTVSANDNENYEYTARVMVSPFGSVGYSESNLEKYDFRLSVAFEYNKNDQVVIPATGAATGNNDLTYGAAVVLKAFKSLFGYFQYYDGSRRTPAGIKTDRDGWLAQVGWLFDKFEIAGRYAEYDPNTNAVIDNNQTEWRGGVSWYMNRHNWKIQADYGVTENEAAAVSINRELKELRIQAQIIF